MLAKHKIRIVLFMILHGLICVSVIAYAKEFDAVLKPIEYTSDVYVDGADFSGFVNLLAFGTNGLISIIALIAYCIGMLIISTILIVPFRFIAIRKESLVSDMELKVTKYIIVVGIVLSMIVGIIMMGIEVFFPMVFMYIVPIIMEIVLYWMALSKRNRIEQEEGTDE